MIRKFIDGNCDDAESCSLFVFDQQVLEKDDYDSFIGHARAVIEFDCFGNKHECDIHCVCGYLLILLLLRGDEWTYVFPLPFRDTHT